MLCMKFQDFFVKMDFLSKAAQRFNRIGGFLVRPVNFGRPYPLAGANMPESLCVCFIRRSHRDFINQTTLHIDAHMFFITIPEFLFTFAAKQ